MTEVLLIAGGFAVALLVLFVVLVVGMAAEQFVGALTEGLERAWRHVVRPGKGPERRL